MAALDRKIKVLVTREIPEIGLNMLREAGFDLTVWPEDRTMPRDELVRQALQNQALLSLSTNKLDAAFLNECRHLEIISQFSAGYDNIDLAEATRLGIPFGNAPGVLSDATADVAFGLMLAVSRKMFHLHKSIISGDWGVFRPKANLGIELKGKTLGVFGLGSIGFEMAKRCKGAYEMEILYHNRRPNETAGKALGAKWVSFDDLLRHSDVLSVHCTLNEETRGIFDRQAFAKMKPEAIFINTSRGGVHNETDLIQALWSGEIWGAGLDVTNPEPMSPDNPLLQMENVAVLPHIGSATIRARDGMSRLAAENIIEFYRTGKVTNLVNPGFERGRQGD